MAVRRRPELHLLRVTLSGDDEQRSRARHDQEPVGQRHVGGDAAGDGAEYEAGGHRREVDDGLVLEPERVREGDGDVRDDDGGELAFVDGSGDRARDDDQADGNAPGEAGRQGARRDRA